MCKRFLDSSASFQILLLENNFLSALQVWNTLLEEESSQRIPVLLPFFYDYGKHRETHFQERELLKMWLEHFCCFPCTWYGITEVSDMPWKYVMEMSWKQKRQVCHGNVTAFPWHVSIFCFQERSSSGHFPVSYIFPIYCTVFFKNSILWQHRKPDLNFDEGDMCHLLWRSFHCCLLVILQNTQPFICPLV